jgi:hypothetical protein
MVTKVRKNIQGIKKTFENAVTAAAAAPTSAAAVHVLIKGRVLAAEEGLCPGGACGDEQVPRM